jgi:uncharacterized membrane protein
MNDESNVLRIPGFEIRDERQFRYSSEDVSAGTYSVMAQGVDAFGPHERIMNHRQNMTTARTIAAYLASLGFAVIAASLIESAPESRTTAANVAAGSLLILAAGIAGFTSLVAKLPAIDIRTSKTPGQS